MSMGGGVSAPQIRFMPTGFITTGLSGNFAGQGTGANGSPMGGGNFFLTEGPNVRGARLGLANAFAEQGNALDRLLGTVQPGFSQFRNAGLADIENQRSSALSNLSDTLAQRRILGSSFANSQVSQSNADFNKMRADFIAQSYLSELEASNMLTQEKFQAIQQGFSSTLQQLDFESGLAAQMSSSVTQSYAQLAEAQAQMQLQAQEFNSMQRMQEMQMLMGGIGSIFGMFGGGGGGI